MEGNNFDFDFGGVEVDFDLGDFDIVTDDAQFSIDERPSDIRYWKPRVDKREVLRLGNFRFARDFVKEIQLEPYSRTYCIVDGSFVFGDVLEAFCAENILFPKRCYVMTLSLSRENIDSFKNCITYFGLKQLDLVLSNYFYSHEKYNLIPYLYQTLDIDNVLDVAISHNHTKIMGIETYKGNKLIMYGSANLKSSGNIEQVMVELNPELYDFNARMVDEIMGKFGTINKRADKSKFKAIGRKEQWQAVREAAQPTTAGGCQAQN